MYELQFGHDGHFEVYNKYKTFEEPFEIIEVAIRLWKHIKLTPMYGYMKKYQKEIMEMFGDKQDFSGYAYNPNLWRIYKDGEYISYNWEDELPKNYKRKYVKYKLKKREGN